MKINDFNNQFTQKFDSRQAISNAKNTLTY